MQTLVDVSRMGCLSLTDHSADIHRWKDTFCSSEPFPDTFPPGISRFQWTLSVPKQNKTNYDMMPYGDHGTEMVKTLRYCFLPHGECYWWMDLMNNMNNFYVYGYMAYICNKEWHYNLTIVHNIMRKTQSYTELYSILSQMTF